MELLFRVMESAGSHDSERGSLPTSCYFQPKKQTLEKKNNETVDLGCIQHFPTSSARTNHQIGVNIKS